MATVDKAEILQYGTGVSGVQTRAAFYLAGNWVLNYTMNFSPVSRAQADYEAAARAEVIAYAATLGDTLTNSDVSFAFVTSDQLGIALSVGAATRSLNTAYQISSTKNSLVNYSVDIATTVNLTGGAVGTVYLEYADDSGFTTNVVEVGRFVNGQTGTLVVGLTLNQTNTGTLSGIIPAGKYARIRTANTTGTPTFTYRSGQEAILG